MIVESKQIAITITKRRNVFCINATVTAVESSSCVVDVLF